MIGVYIGMGVAVLLILIGILRTIDWYSVFNKRYGDDPQKAKVYVNIGGREQFYDGWYVGNDDKFLFYRYPIGRRMFTVAVPMDWEPVYVRGRRKILVNFGNEYAIPLKTGDAYPASMGATLLDVSISKKLAVDMINSLESRKGFKLGMILIIVVVAVVGFIVYRNMTSKPEVIPNQPPVTIPADNKTGDAMTDQEILDIMGGK